ncbi:uncharacterized protein PITG_20082 [Phytophthora infestans T30-4]|uniref:Transmembrane protein n=1 Tax=Phytophthora infestans (strain T30-4) TaxID=403677 RepID=D0P0Q7_PHYIT|nr:uncharacterized protein PITG_20082 [Phytophthora infestans T30-4]EEY53025.1 hypothetical protein PITG_20082 [Phytophthora infestans T30-4]|eukprot:XP_002896095.1 hypothetical protein PITG_20082 [Phytophthora infestans T30-4]
MKASASTPTLEAAKAQRQKELLRKKKGERRAHAKQRAAEKQRRLDEKKQKRELKRMIEEDAPAIDRADTSTPCFGTELSTRSKLNIIIEIMFLILFLFGPRNVLLVLFVLFLLLQF